MIPTIIADIEGLDFLEGRLERLEESHKRGVRHVQLVHYTPNDIAQLVDAMLRAGFRPDEAGKIIGGNYLRIFEAAVG